MRTTEPPKVNFWQRIKNFFECISCEHKKGCPVRFRSRLIVHFSLPGRLSSNYYRKSLCRKEEDDRWRFVYPNK